MTSGMKTITYPVKDIAAAKQLYGQLFGVEPYIDEPYYAAFNAGGNDVGLDPNGHGKGMTGPIAYWHVDDINKSLEALLDAGAEAGQPAQDVGGGALIATVRDADGNVTGLFQAPPAGDPQGRRGRRARHVRRLGSLTVMTVWPGCEAIRILP